MNALGAISRDSGHRRVPAPPETMTETRGGMRIFGASAQHLESLRVYPILMSEPAFRIQRPRCIMTFSAHCHDVPRRLPGVNWFRRGLHRSLGHAEALVLVRLEQLQT